MVYYGLQVPADEVPAINAPLLLHYAGLDERVNAGIAAYEAALKANDKRYTIYMYPGVNHAFNNDTGGHALQQGGRRPCLGADAGVLQGAARYAAARGVSSKLARARREFSPA